MDSSTTAKFIDMPHEQEIKKDQQMHAFILVNSHSGSWHGQQLVRRVNRKVIMGCTHFYVVDLYSRDQREHCFAHLNQLAQKENHVYILMCGGDGTVEWVINLAIHYKINFQKVAFGVLPIGTGNDFARSVGWDKFKFTVSRKKLEQLAMHLPKCEIGYYDVWECRILSQGKITQIKNGAQRCLKSKELKKIFSNYFGIGTDARITYFAQKINAKSVLLKKISYGFAWIASLCKNSQKLANMLKSFTNYGSESSSSLNINKELQLSDNVTISQSENLTPETDLYLDENDRCITFINSTSSMELSHIWDTPHCVDSSRSFKKQKIDDGLIELVSYRNQLSILMERSMHMAKKVAQGEGPFVLKFRHPPGKQKQDTYIHINGQPYKIENLESVEIRKSRQISNGRMKVLFYRQ